MSTLEAMLGLGSRRDPMRFTAHEFEFEAVVGAEPRLVRVVDIDAHEGPVYVPSEDALYFTTLPRELRVDVKRLDLASGAVTTVRADANMANGMTLARDGRLLVCEQGTRDAPARIAALDPVTRATETVVVAWRDMPFNSPNDVVVAGDGSIWFTDPSYGFLQGFRPPPRAGDYVYRHDPIAGRTDVVSASFDKPNGLAFSPDERVLYVGDSGANHEPGTYDSRRPHHIVAFDVHDGRLENERVFAVVAPGFPDGLKVDAAGRVYASSFSGVQVFNRGGTLIGEIQLPGAVNFTFGGPDRNVLFITTDTAIWAAVIETKGA
jgi:gluconolactonase